VDDALTTNSIDFSATDKMTLWAGVRKLSTATGVLAELSANLNTNDGTFNHLMNDSANDWVFTSKGTLVSAAQSTGAYAAPVTTVNTGIGDISGDVTTLRINGSQVTTNTANQGTGNFGNYPLFIGARNQTSLYFNGWLTSLIGRGASTTAGQISATEQWVNGKTGAY
jgi:hypothetical protein